MMPQLSPEEREQLITWLKDVAKEYGPLSQAALWSAIERLERIVAVAPGASEGHSCSHK